MMEAVEPTTECVNGDLAAATASGCLDSDEMGQTGTDEGVPVVVEM
jgi:hypothetical protein